MPSESKKRKLKSRYVWKTYLKNKSRYRCKKVLFYTSSERKSLKEELENEKNEI